MLHQDMIKLFNLLPENHLKHAHLGGTLPNHDLLEYMDINPYALLYTRCTHADIPDLCLAVKELSNKIPGQASIVPHRESWSDYSTVQVKFSTVHFLFKAIRDDQPWLVHPTEHTTYCMDTPSNKSIPIWTLKPTQTSVLSYPKKDSKASMYHLPDHSYKKTADHYGIHTAIGATTPKIHKNSHPHHPPGQFIIMFHTARALAPFYFDN